MIQEGDEVDDFRRRNAGFLSLVDHLQESVNRAFSRRFRAATVSDEVVFFLSRVCVDDFQEILILLSNGHGIGGQKLLRGMYERAVTGHYLALHPEKAQDFLDFHWVALHKLRAAIERTWGSESLLHEMKDEIEEEFSRVRERFMVTHCNTCGSQKLNFSWSKTDFVSMAHEIESLRSYIVPAYYLPLAHTHSTAQTFLRRLRDEDGAIAYDGSSQRDEADRTLMTSHSLLIEVLELQQSHFKVPGLDVMVKERRSEFFSLWRQ